MMKHTLIKSIINNTFLPNYDTIENYFEENNLVYTDQAEIEGGFTLKYQCSDDEETFRENLKTQPEYWYYRTHSVIYTLNSLGYRTREFDQIDWKESIVMFGCSHVFGTGVTDEHTIPYFLEQLCGRPVINMGIGGSSIQTALHNSIILNDSEYPTPKAVVNMWTGLNRYQLYETNFTDHIGSGNFLDNRFEKRENIVSFNLMNIKMMRNLWKNKTIYFEGTTFDQEKLINKLNGEVCCEPLDTPKFDHEFARDLQHYSHMFNHEIAKKIYEKIKPQLENS
jgi:hypothetical protein